MRWNWLARWSRLGVLAMLAGLALLAEPARATEVPDIDTPMRSDHRASRDAALVIGNEAYLALPQATYATADAYAFRQWLLQGRGLSKHRVASLENVDPYDIGKQLRRMRWKVRKGGTMWIYFAGHGAVQDGQRYLLGVSASMDQPSANGVRIEDLVQPFLAGRRARRVVVVLDAGFGNLGRDGLQLAAGQEVEVPDGFPDLGPKVVIWAAARDGSPAEAFPLARHGLFTWLAVGGLRGWADGEIDGERDGRVTLEEAQVFVARAGHQVGRLNHPTIDPRPEAAGWVVEQGDDLEATPADEVFDSLARADRQRRVTDAEARVKAEAAAFWRDTMALAKQGGEEGRQALEAFIQEYDDVRLSLEWSLVVPEVREARKALAHFEELASAEATPAEALEPCDDLVALESGAMLGHLTDGQRACLENRIQTERLQTLRNKISRLLLVDAEARGDKADWERLIVRHLEDIDRSDPDLCMRYAVYLFKNGDLEDLEDAIHWADYALENKYVWKPPQYAKKVSSLFRLRAEAANRLWVAAEKRYREDPTPENDEETQEYRGQAMDYAREWLDFARAAGQDYKAALNLCTSAAGTADFCLGR